MIEGRETFRPLNGAYPGPQTRGKPQRPDLSQSAAWTIGVRGLIPPGLWQFADNPPPDMCDWEEIRKRPGPGAYRPNVTLVQPRPRTTDLAPPVHWDDGDGISAIDLLRKCRMPARRQLYTSGSEVRALLRESLRPTAERTLSATQSSHGGRPSLRPLTVPARARPTTRGDFGNTVNPMTRSWHSYHYAELKSEALANPLPPRERTAPVFGDDIRKPREPIGRKAAAFLSPQEVRERNWDCRSIRHSRKPTVYSGRIGSP